MWRLRSGVAASGAAQAPPREAQMVDWLAPIEAKDLAVPIASFAAGLLLALLLLSMRYRLRLRELDLPFLKVDLSRLEDLSPVKLFSPLTRVALQPQPAPE